MLLNSISRRVFVSSSIGALGAGALALIPDFSGAREVQSLTVQDIINLVVKQVPGAPFAQTVDTLKAGKPDQIVTGVVTTMFATIEVIRQAIALKANFIIAHEPTFYNHLDDTSSHGNDPVYKFKKDLLEKNGIAVWRCHDYIHSLVPDGVLTGVLATLGWEQYCDPQNRSIVTLPAQSLQNLVIHMKAKIGTPHVRVIGPLTQMITRIAVMPGAAGGKRQIQAIMDLQPELVVCGEVSEWETAEYIRDAWASGANRSLVVLGHAVSEEPGMVWMKGWLAPQIPSLTINHIASKNPFTWV